MSSNNVEERESVSPTHIPAGIPDAWDYAQTDENELEPDAAERNYAMFIGGCLLTLLVIILLLVLIF